MIVEIDEDDYFDLDEFIDEHLWEEYTDSESFLDDFEETWEDVE